ncbi:MAG: hypothetical protein QRY74_01580 [Chlamydia sp.]
MGSWLSISLTIFQRVYIMPTVQPIIPAESADNSSAVDPVKMANRPVAEGGRISTVASLTDLKTKDPKFHKALCMAIAKRILHEQERAIRRFKEEQRKMRS